MAASKAAATPLSLPPSSSKSILKSNTLKRESSDPVTPAKRRRVIFSDDAPVVHEIGPRARAAVRAEVAKTLQKCALGDKRGYEKLKRHFHPDQPQPSARSKYLTNDKDDHEPPLGHEEMSDYIHALASLPTTLRERPYRDLVKAVLDCDWVGRDDRFVHGYIEFLACLASVGGYLPDSLGMIFDWFQDRGEKQWIVGGYPVVTKAVVDERLHMALKRLLEVSTASASKGVCAFTRRTFPAMGATKRTHLDYLAHILRIMEYHPRITGQLLDIIMENITKMDISLQSFLDLLDDTMLMAVRQALSEGAWFGLNDDDEEDDENSDDDSDDGEDESLRTLKNIKNRIEVLDSTMGLLFNLYKPHFEDAESEDAQKYYGIMVRHFDSFLLRTQGTRHVQFLLFHFVQRSETLTLHFIQRCEKYALDKVPSEARDGAIAYLGSFVARGRHLSSTVVQYVFSRILERLEECRVTHERACQGPNRDKYYSYYSLFQAAMYIFCFRWKDLLRSTPDGVDRDDPWSYANQDLDWGERTRMVLNSNVMSKLNPLKVCSQAIVKEFASLALKLNLVYVMSILELNKRIRLSQFGCGAGERLRDIGGTTQDDGALQLDSYFPFDPYYLPESKGWLEGDYLNWEPLPGLHAHDEEIDDEVSDEEADQVMGEELEEEGTSTGDEEKEGEE